MDTNAQWPQGIGVVKAQAVDQKKPRPQKEQAINCPRCSSTNTKFCYYNNYSLSQPRYFCKTCRRYWTEGGTLRNVPVGGGSRKNKRSSSSTVLPPPVNPSKKLAVPSPPNFSPQNNSKIHQGQDLNLAYNPSHYNGFPEFIPFPFGSDHDAKNLESQNPNTTCSNNPSYFPVMELLKTGISSRGSLTSFMANIPPVSDHSNSVFSSAGNNFPVHGFKSSLGFSLDHGVDHSQNGYGNLQDHTNSSRILFPFEELKPNEQFEQDRGQAESNGYWNGMLPEGSW